MAGILPDSINDVTNTSEIRVRNYPTYTYYVDPVKNQITGMTDGVQAMTQAVEIICEVERNKFSIFTPNFGLESDGLIGQDYGFIISEFKRRLLDAFSVDDRILGISEYDYSEQIDDYVVIYITVSTVYGDVSREITLEV